MLFFPLINVQMPTIVGILTFMSRKNFMLYWVEHEKSFITSGPGCLYWPQPISTFTVWLALVTNTWPLTQRVLPPWQLTSSRKTSAQWCCIITTPNWPIGLGGSWRWERLITSEQVTDLSTAYNIKNQTQGAKVIGPYPYLQWPLSLAVLPSWAWLAWAPF